MNENITKEQLDQLKESAKCNFIVMDENFEPVCWENGVPVIYGSVFEDIGSDNFHTGEDTAIMSVFQYCRLFNVMVEDIMDYHSLDNGIEY